jgi:ASC-1-like (ASCH) protein
MKLQPHPFDKIKEGTKTIEVRLFDEKRREIRLNDVIEFQREPERTETIRAEVIGLLNYKTFFDLINDFSATDFGDDDKEILLEKIYTFYTKEQEIKHSVLGIKIKLLSQ